MKIECPSCSAAYDVPEARLAPGRTVKCARCAATWTPVVAEVAAPGPVTPVLQQPDPPDTRNEAEPETTPEPEIETPGPAQELVLEPAVPELAIEPAALDRARSIPLIAAWVLSIALLATLAWAAIDRRAAVMQAWPASTRAYAAFGLAAE